jgi:hypothetical protein
MTSWHAPQSSARGSRKAGSKRDTVQRIEECRQDAVGRDGNPGVRKKTGIWPNLPRGLIIRQVFKVKRREKGSLVHGLSNRGRGREGSEVGVQGGSADRIL